VILNAADSRVAKLSSPKASQRITFAPGPKIAGELKNEDSWHGKKSQDNTTINADLILEKSNGEVGFKFGSENLSLRPMVSGVHNHLNLVAAFGVLKQVKTDLPNLDLLAALSKVEPAFGRGERISLPNSAVTLLLSKNPSSFVQTLSAAEVEKYDSVTVVINDAYADSRDVSWLWDVDLSRLKDSKELSTGGTRAYDMAVRLKHEGMTAKDITLDLGEIIDKLEKKPGEHAVFCTYTAMLGLRKLLVKKGHVEQVL
jgi:lipid II isoglutaminyl synthase (glutamine-hydrolysing)